MAARQHNRAGSPTHRWSLVIMQKDNDIQELINRSRSGDRVAYQKVFERFHRTVYSLAIHLVQNPDDADDITQEAFLRAWERIKQLTSPHAFRNWLLTITVNLARSLLRKRTSEPVVTAADLWESADWESEQEEEKILEQPTPDIINEAEEREKIRLIHQAVAALPLFFREVVILHYFEGLDIGEVAQVLKIPVGTVKSRLARARQRLRDALADLL
ncbi:MAG: sigma-70 family RNA polymerase sigma factor [Armatimonadetes bacterium]|nr:sigma-70 family RNA polymerase sigma factor [Armatimonadota bacterium]MDW8122580.1 sigma-70 family RNA polymerase sigma factor [Armatimonadota bacterium]